jgi:hypothetical protein
MRLSIALLALLVFAPPSAQATVLRVGLLSDGPVVSSGGVAWIDGRAVRTAVPGEAPRARLAVPVAPHDFTWLDGSPEGFALSAFAYETRDPRETGPFPVDVSAVWAERPDGGVDRLVDSRCPVGRVERDGVVLAYGRGPCTAAEPPQVVIRAPDGERAFASAPGSPVHVAGRYVAWHPVEAGGSVAVYDAIADREVLRVGGGPGGPALGLLDLQADGKVLVGVRGAQTAWASPSEPALHPLDVPAAYVQRLDGDRLLVRPGSRRLDVVGLDGSRRAVATASGLARLGRGDLAGDRVAFWRPTCRGDEIRLRSVADPPLAFALPRPCRARLLAPARVAIGEWGIPTADVSVYCGYGRLAPCGEVVVRARDGRVLAAWEARIDEATPSTELWLTAAGVRRFARRARVAVRIEVRSPTPRGRLVQRPARTVLRVTSAARRALRRCLRTAPAERCAEP